MIRTRTAGIGLAALFALVSARPLMADSACQAALGDIAKLQNTISQLQALNTSIQKRQADAAAASASGAAEQTVTAADTYECPVCHMKMTTEATAANTRAVTISGKTWYCCAGCDMSKIVDK